jgi:thiamine biosynthesis lipoprotein
MNTGIYAQIYTASRRPLGRTIEDLFRYYERTLSRFLPSSELSLLNTHDGDSFAAGQDLFEAIQAALWAAQQTNGVFDPTILPYLEYAGYDRTFRALPNPRPMTPDDSSTDSDATTAKVPLGTGMNYRNVSIDPFTRLITRPVGLQFDLGGMGKGWTVDRIVDELRDVGYYLINAGGDIYAYGAPPGAQGWEIHLAHPLKPHLKIATLKVAHQAVATSTIARRRWIHNGRIQHHLIDPRLGRPADGSVVSASVVAGRVFTAEVYAKAALILGIDRGLAFLESLPGVEGLMAPATGEILMTSGMSRYVERLSPTGY